MSTTCSLNFITRVRVEIFLEAPLQCTPVPETYAIICYRQCSLTRAVSCRAWKCLLRREGETRHVAALGDERGGILLTYLRGRGTGRNEGRKPWTCVRRIINYSNVRAACCVVRYIHVERKRVTLGGQVDHTYSEWLLVKNSSQLSGQL